MTDLSSPRRVVDDVETDHLGVIAAISAVRKLFI